MKKTFFLTLILFLLVWAFFSIDCWNASEKKCQKYSIAQLQTEYFTETLFGHVAENGSKNDQIREIDLQIKELEAMKRGFEARALRHDDQAQRLQFEDRAILETRRHHELAEENRAKAQRVQEEIDRLQSEKRKLLQNGV